MIFIPTVILNKIITALIIGLTASGVYSQVKPLKLLDHLPQTKKIEKEKINQGEKVTDQTKSTDNKH